MNNIMIALYKEDVKKNFQRITLARNCTYQPKRKSPLTSKLVAKTSFSICKHFVPNSLLSQ